MEQRRCLEGSDSYAGTPLASDTSSVLSSSTVGTTPSSPPLEEREHERQ
jgi:hypothetical protein